MLRPTFTHRRDGGGSHLHGEQSRCLLAGHQTGGRFALTESVLRPGAEPAPLHVHSREDETFYVIEGRIVAHAGDQRQELGPGGSVFLPRGIPHRIHAAGADPVRLLMLVAPAGLERFFAEVEALAAAGRLDPGRLAEVAAGYGVTILGGP